MLTRLPAILFLLVVCKIKRKNLYCKQSQTKPILLVCALKGEVVPITLCVDIRFCEGARAQFVRHCRSQEWDTETLPSFHHCQQEGRSKTKSVSCGYITCTKSVCHVWAIPSFSTVAMWSWAIVNCFTLWYWKIDQWRFILRPVFSLCAVLLFRSATNTQVILLTSIPDLPRLQLSRAHYQSQNIHTKYVVSTYMYIYCKCHTFIFPTPTQAPHLALPTTTQTTPTANTRAQHTAWEEEPKHQVYNEMYH